MLKVNNLQVSYGKKSILRGLDFEIGQNDITAVIGESGTGKTTLAMSIMGLLKSYSKDSKVSGNIVFRGTDISGAKEEDLRSLRWKRVSMVFQNVDNILNPVMTVYQQINEVMDGGKNSLVINEMLGRVGFPISRVNSYPDQLSMGEKQRVLVAMAYILDPDLVILDEPVSSLDFESKNSIISTMKDLNRYRAVLVVTHDLDTARRLSKKIMVLYGGNIVEAGPTEAVFENPGHPYTRGLIRSYPSMERTKDLQGIKGSAEFINRGCSFWPRCTQALEICREEKPLLKDRSGRKIACHRGGIIPILNIKNISKSYRREQLLRSVSFDIYEGETAALIGRSGSGKTTLAKIIMGLVQPEEGEILLEGKPVRKWDSKFYGRVQMIFQDINSSISHRLNILEAVMEPLIIQKWGNSLERIKKVKKILNEVELQTDDAFIHQYPHQLSGGELQRVAIARSLVLSPRLLIADEPTSSLDPSIQAKVLKLLNNIQEERGLGMLFITHDLGVARKVSDRVLRIYNCSIMQEKLK